MGREHGAYADTRRGRGKNPAGARLIANRARERADWYAGTVFLR